MHEFESWDVSILNKSENNCEINIYLLASLENNHLTFHFENMNDKYYLIFNDNHPIVILQCHVHLSVGFVLFFILQCLEITIFIKAKWIKFILMNSSMIFRKIINHQIYVGNVEEFIATRVTWLDIFAMNVAWNPNSLVNIVHINRNLSIISNRMSFLNISKKINVNPVLFLSPTCRWVFVILIWKYYCNEIILQ